MTILVLFGSLLILILLSVPIGVAIGVSTFITIFTVEDLQLLAITQKAFNALDSFPLMAIPLFVLAGVLMGRGGVAKRLLNLAESLVGSMAGGLAIVTVLACMFFAAISGSGPATVAAIGSFMIPAMVEKGYGRGFSTAITAAAGSMGPIIPPSISFIILGFVVGLSISDLFLAGAIPGILIGVSLMVYSYFRIKKKKIDMPSNKEGSKFQLKEVWRAFRKSIWAVLTPVIILGGIYAGIFTPTEAAAVAVGYALIVGIFVYKEMRWKEIYESLIETLRITGGILYLIGLSIAFAYLLAIERIPTTIAELLLGVSDNPIIIILLINLLLLLVGAFIDTVAAIVILSPILLPIATAIDMHPIHFGVMMVLNLTIGYTTPPLGVNLFVASTVGRTPFDTVAKAVLPMLLVLLIVLLTVSFVPQLSLFLPELLG